MLKSLRALLGGALLAVSVAIPEAIAQSESKAPRGERRAYFMDSGPIANAGPHTAVTYRRLVLQSDAHWMRLHFGTDIRVGPGSLLRVTSIFDGEVQELDASDLAMWSLSTAYFNGNMLLVELVAAPGSTDNRVVIDGIELEVSVALETGSCGICGPDNRVSSNEDFACRLMPTGCSATVYNDDSCLVSAGHCLSAGQVAQFNVPASSGNCNTNNPPVADQFPVTDYNAADGGVGNDWAVCTTGTNNLGQTAFQRFGEIRPIAPGPPSIGNGIEIWGYGIDSQCTLSQTQQYSAGAVTSVLSLYFEHNADATFGNSGSALIHDGMILGINTHCPCNNVANRMDHPSFLAARTNLCGADQVPDGACCFADGTCTVVSGDACDVAGGVHQGALTTCSGQCIPRGGCCFSGGQCTVLEETECIGQGGVYTGDGSGCTGSCSDPGACCLSTGDCVLVDVVICDAAAGTFTAGGSCAPNTCPGACPADLDASGDVGFDDLVELLSAWGPCPGCPADLDASGDVGFDDLVELLSAWGDCT